MKLEEEQIALSDKLDQYREVIKLLSVLSSAAFMNPETEEIQKKLFSTFTKNQQLLLLKISVEVLKKEKKK